MNLNPIHGERTVCRTFPKPPADMRVSLQVSPRKATLARATLLSTNSLENLVVVPAPCTLAIEHSRVQSFLFYAFVRSCTCAAYYVLLVEAPYMTTVSFSEERGANPLPEIECTGDVAVAMRLVRLYLQAYMAVSRKMHVFYYN
jgi:hypothetical protein